MKNALKLFKFAATTVVAGGTYIIVNNVIKSSLPENFSTTASGYKKVSVKLATFFIGLYVSNLVEKQVTELIDSNVNAVKNIKDASVKYKGWTKEEILEDLAKQQAAKSE